MLQTNNKLATYFQAKYIHNNITALPITCNRVVIIESIAVDLLKIWARNLHTLAYKNKWTSAWRKRRKKRNTKAKYASKEESEEVYKEDSNKEGSFVFISFRLTNSELSSGVVNLRNSGIVITRNAHSRSKKPI